MSRRVLALLSLCSLFALVTAASGPVMAEDFTVDTATTTTNGGNTIDGGDTLTITEDGSIQTTGNSVNAIETMGSDNAITNNGTISTAGQSGYGIYNLSNNTPVINSGAISTLGGGAFGIYNRSSDFSPVTNSGSISTTGQSGYGIVNLASDFSPITNSGSISTAGIAANGIHNESSDSSPVTNSGSILTQASVSYGIFNLSTNSPVTNSGSILTLGGGAFGIENASAGGSTVTNSGSITTRGIGATGIHNVSFDSPVINSGSISIAAENAYGIFNASTNSPVTNSGTISTEGRYGYGIINVSTDSPVTNSGAISTAGENAYGILNESTGSPVTNSGSITTAGDFSFAMYDSSTDSPVTNSGTISTLGESSIGMYSVLATNSPLTNSGSITTEGNGASGIYSLRATNSAVTNTGSVRTKGTDAHGIESLITGNSPVSNSGLVVSERSDAFRMNSGDGVLNLLAPGYIGGAINLVSATTVNIVTGPSHSVLWDLSTGTMVGGAPNISGTVPWFYNSATQQFATYDPTALAGSLDALGDMTSLLSQVGRDGLDGKGLWVTGFGGRYDHDGDAMTLGRDIAQWGVAMGYRGQAFAGFDWGVMAGYINNELDAESRWTKSYAIEGEGWFAGLNGKQMLGGIAIDFGVTGGRVDYDQSRFVNDNLALTNGLTLGKSWADSSYAGWFVSPEVGVSTGFAALNGWSFTPAARLRYASQWLDGFSESGSNANAVVGSRDLGMIEASGEIEAAKTDGNATVSGRIGYLSRISTGDEAVSMTLIGVNNSVGFGDTDTEALYAGAGFDLNLGLARLALDVTGFLSGDFTGAQAMGQISVPF